MVRHAEVIRDEIQQLNSEFMELVDRSGTFTPTINFLIDQYKNQARLLPDGSRSIHVRWSEALIPILLVILLGSIPRGYFLEEGLINTRPIFSYFSNVLANSINACTSAKLLTKPTEMRTAPVAFGSMHS